MPGQKRFTEIVTPYDMHKILWSEKKPLSSGIQFVVTLWWLHNYGRFDVRRARINKKSLNFGLKSIFSHSRRFTSNWCQYQMSGITQIRTIRFQAPRGLSWPPRGPSTISNPRPISPKKVSDPLAYLSDISDIISALFDNPRRKMYFRNKTKWQSRTTKG